MKIWQIVLVCTVITFGAVLYLTTTPEKQTDTQAAKAEMVESTLTIATERLPMLMSHVHDVGDSIYDMNHHETLASEQIIVTEDIWITGMELTLHNAPPTSLHHAMLFQLDERSLTCGAVGQPKELLAVSEDSMYDNALTFPDGYGIFLPKGTPLLLMAMLHNPEPPIGPGGMYSDVFVDVELAYEPGAQTERSKPIDFYFLHLEDVPCKGENFTFTVPANTTEYVRGQSDEAVIQPGRITMETDGEIVYAGGHLHGWEGGKELRVLLNREIFEVYETSPDPDIPYVWNTDHGPRAHNITAGDTLEVQAVYENLTPYELTGAMGIYGFYFAPRQP